MYKNDSRHLRQLLKSRLTDTNETQPRPLALHDLPVSLEELFGKDFRRGLRPAAVLVPVIDHPSGLTVLLTQRSDALRAHAGQIAFPGGSREGSDTDLAATALREAQEEVGLDPVHVRILGYLDDYPTISRFLVTPVVGLVATEAHIQADGNEVSHTLEVPLERVLDEHAYQREILERFNRKLPFYALRHDGYKIWGATAGMLLNLRKRMMDRDES